MNILLIRPKPHPESIGLHSLMICEPLELMTLAGVLLANGHHVEIIDMILEKANLKEILSRRQTDIVGLTGYISHINIIKEYAQTIKSHNPQIKVAIGGVHASVCPQDFEETPSKTTQENPKTKNLLADNTHTAPHIDFIAKDANALYEYLGCSVTKNILPHRALPEKYLKHYYYLFQEQCALIKTSFGCPYNCKFCFCKEISPYKARKIDDVITELQSFNQKNVYIVDDDFLYNRSRLLEFYEKIKRNNIKKEYLVYGRADFIAQNEDIIILLKEIGLTSVIVGIEASNQEQLDSYNKRTSCDDNTKAIATLHKHSLECYATIILGIDWTEKDFKQLYTFLKANKLIFVNLQPLTPMPKTPFFEEYKNSLIIPYKESEKWDMAHLVIQPTGISVRKYYWNILKIYHKLALHNSPYMIKKYGLLSTLKLSMGALHITYQYLRKIVKG